MRTTGECSIEGCSEVTGVPGTARGLCNKHYTRWKRHGDPEHTEVFSGASVQEHFEYYATHRPENECWLWQGYFAPGGYGVIHSKGRTVQAHRVSFETAGGVLAEGEIVRHKCDNPPCVNPEHLESGSHQDNSDDKWSRGRGNPATGERNWNSKLAASDVLIIKDVLGQGIYSQSFLGRAFGVRSQTIWSIHHSKSWAHIAQDFRIKSPAGGTDT